MRKTKQLPTATPPAGRVLRTNAEKAEWAFGLERRRRDVELARLAETEQWARTLHEDAAGQLRVLRPGAGVRLPGGQTRLDFRPPVAPRLQAADYVERMSSHILESVAPARGALQALQQSAPLAPRRHELRAAANAALLEVEQFRSRLMGYLQQDQLAHVKIMRGGRRKGSRGPLGRVLEDYLTHAAAPQRTFEALWDHLHALADTDHATIQEVLDEMAECHPGAHVHWINARGRERVTRASSLRNRLRDVARSLGLPLPR